MKKVFLLLFVMFPSLVFAAGINGVSYYHSRVVVRPAALTVDGVMALTTVTSSTVPYLSVIGATGQPAALVYSSSAATVTASLVTPNDLIGGVGKTKFYAICGLSAATNTAQVRGTFTLSAGLGLSNSATTLVGYQGVTTTTGYQLGSLGMVPAVAYTSMQAVELVTVSSTTTALTGLNVQPNRLLTINVLRSNGTNADLYIYGIVMDYMYDPAKRR